jgi:hypothetical protein
MLKATHHPERENIKIHGEISDFVSLHSTIRKVMLEAASYEKEHHGVSDFLIVFLEKLETAYSEVNQPGKYSCRACQPFSDYITLQHEELFMLCMLLKAIAQYADMDQQDQACLLLIESFTAKLQTPVLGDKNEDHYDSRQLQSFRNIKAFVASFPQIADGFFSKHQHDER